MQQGFCPLHRPLTFCWQNEFLIFRRLATLRRAAIDQLLRANEKQIKLTDEAIARVDVCQMAANRPIEDFYSVSKCLSSNASLFGVFDGHGGASCARQVSTRLFGRESLLHLDYICSCVLDKHRVFQIPVNEQLQWLAASAFQGLPPETDERHQRNVRTYHKKFKQTANTATTVRSSIQSAFLAFDEDLSQGAMPDSRGRVHKSHHTYPFKDECERSSQRFLCTCGAYSHVANIGDCSAVLGVHLANGLIARQLTRPHTAENVDEINRIRSAHPASENRTILRGDRLLGELYPLRAFGDVRYKWPMELQKVVLEPLGMPAPQHLLTPPYLTAHPEVFYHRLTSNDRFLVLATDGLWEFLDPDSVVRLISDHSLGMQTMSTFQPQPQDTLGDIFAGLKERKSGDSGKPLDDNSATHLVRNALGGCSGGMDLQYARLEESLMLPPGVARSYRDDITVVVLHFNESFLCESG